jgi:hypothetical protein
VTAETCASAQSLSKKTEKAPKEAIISEPLQAHPQDYRVTEDNTMEGTLSSPSERESISERQGPKLSQSK